LGRLRVAQFLFQWTQIMTHQEWIQLELTCPTEYADSLATLLIEQGALGTEDRDHTPPPAPFEPTPPPTPNPHTTLVAYFESSFDTTQQQSIVELAERFHLPPHTLKWSKLRDDGWSTKWQSFFKPLPIGQHILICPTWETAPDTTRHLLWLDPGMAFGTGHHATTKGCIHFLEELIPHTTELLDVGCGSGILSMAAAKLGATSILGVDIDAEAVQIAIENAERNQIDHICTFATTPIESIKQTFPLVVANIQAHILTPMAPHLQTALQPQGTLLMSGIWHTFRDALVQTFTDRGFQLLQEHEEESWITLTMQAP
jgi:ribosomal protein L11 methyltransferase